MIVYPRLIVRMTFLPHPLSGVRHTGILVFDPTDGDWSHARKQTEMWYSRGWCTYNERQLFLNDVWRAMDSVRAVNLRITR